MDEGGGLPAYNFFRIYVLPQSNLCSEEKGISAISSVRSRGENQNEHKGASRSQRELERVVLASSLSLPSFFPPNVKKSIPELSFRFVSFGGCSAAVSPRLFRSSRAFVPVLLRFPDRFSSIVGNYGTHCPVSLFSRRKWREDDVSSRQKEMAREGKRRRPRRTTIPAIRRLFRKLLAILSDERSLL